MKIGIDVRMIFSFQTGIGNYRKSLMQALFENDRKNEYVLVGNEGQPLAEAYDNVTFAVIKSKANHPLQHILLPSELKKLNLDIFYTTHWGATLRMPGKYVLEIPDLIYHHYPEFGSWKSKLYEFFLEKRIARNANAIVTISDFVKKDIATMLGVNESKITNIKGAASEEYRVIEDESYIDSVLDEYGLGGRNRELGSEIATSGLSDSGQAGMTNPPRNDVEGGNVEYFVYLGNRRPHKNLVGLLQAFEAFRVKVDGILKHADAVQDDTNVCKEGKVRLVIIGGVDAKGRDQDSLRIKKQLEVMKYREDVLLLGWVDREPTAAIFNRAIALIHPSMHEGFGLTPLEAMNCGCPVITSNVTSVPEVVGDAGILINPKDVREITSAMLNVYKDNALRENLSRKSLERAKLFSWKKTARMLLGVFESCYY